MTKVLFVNVVIELRNALLAFVGGSFVLEFIKEGLVSNALDLHILLVGAVALTFVTSFPYFTHS